MKGQKQHLVRNAIYEAAVELFAERGFDDTTVEEVAQAAGVSRRSLFRYFSSKDDLLAHSVMNYQHVLLKAIESCPPGTSPLRLIRAAVEAGARHTASEPLTRTVIDLSSRSASAMKAQQSRMVDLAESLAGALARTLRISQKSDSRPRLYANLIVVILNVAIQSWFEGKHEDIPVAAEQELYETMRVFSEEIGAVGSSESQDKTQSSAPRSKQLSVPKFPSKAPRKSSSASKRH